MGKGVVRQVLAVAVVAALIPAVGGLATASHHDTKASKSKRGPRGPRGLRGPQGPAGVAQITEVVSPPVAQCGLSGGGNACQTARASASCPTGSYAIGGGYDATGTNQAVTVSRRISATAYGVVAVNWDQQPQTLRATVTCASGPGLSAFAVPN